MEMPILYRLYSQVLKKCIVRKIREDIHESLNILCKYKNVEVIVGAICIDYVHLSVAISLKLSISNFL